MTNEENLKIDFYDLCGIDSIGMSDDDKIIAYGEKVLNWKKIICDGYTYWYERKLAKHHKDICLGTKDPDKYCNGVYLYSDKDPGDGLEFVVVKTDNPEIKIR